MRPAQRSRSRSRSSQRSGETLSSGDARRFRECHAWARSPPYATRAEESPGASQPQASQPQAREAGDTEPQASQVDGEVRREAVLSQAIARWDEAFQAAVAAFVDAVAACGSVEEMMQAWSVASPLGAQTRRGPVMGLIERGAPQ